MPEIDLTPDPVGDMRRRLTADPEPRHVVAAEYTDEGLAATIARTHPEYAAAMKRLLTVPADWRQSVMAAANALSSATVTTAVRPAKHPNHISIETAVEQQVAAFHAGRLPNRMEQVAQPEAEGDR